MRARPHRLRTAPCAYTRVYCSDNSHQLDRDEFKRALQIWGMNDENALNEVRPRCFHHHAYPC